MRYGFKCYDCELGKEVDARPFAPPTAPQCPTCGHLMNRVYGCQINTSGCQDVDEIPEGQRVAYGGQANISKGQATAIERAHHRHNEKTRRDLADGGNKGGLRKTHQIPAALYHGKIKQTKDPNYWDDPKNRDRHKSTKVDA